MRSTLRSQYACADVGSRTINSSVSRPYPGGREASTGTRRASPPTNLSALASPSTRAGHRSQSVYGRPNSTRPGRVVCGQLRILPRRRRAIVQEPRCLSSPTHAEHQHRRCGDDVDMCEGGSGARNSAVGPTPRRCLPRFRQVARREFTSPPVSVSVVRVATDMQKIGDERLMIWSSRHWIHVRSGHRPASVSANPAVATTEHDQDAWELCKLPLRLSGSQALRSSARLSIASSAGQAPDDPRRAMTAGACERA